MTKVALLVNDGNAVATISEPEHLTTRKAKNIASSVLHRSLHVDPHIAVSAEGNFLHLSNGQKIFDATGGAAVACLGHGNDRYATVDPRKTLLIDEI